MTATNLPSVPPNANRYISLLRLNVHRPAAADVLERQRHAVQEYAGARGLRCVDEVIIHHLGARSSTDEEQVVALADRKRMRNDFDLIVVSDWARFTRNGVMAFARILHEFAQAGVKLASASQGEWAGLSSQRLLLSLQEHRQHLSDAVRRGQKFAIERGHIPHTAVPLFGVDRLHMDATGNAICIVRTENDGSQSVLDPTTGTVRRQYPRTAGERWCGFRKHPHDRVTLVPGSAESVNMVRDIFAGKFQHGRSASEIARHLNALGAVGLRGHAWTQGSVARVLANSIYLGLGIAYKHTSVHYNVRDQGMPPEGNRHRPSRRHRPPTEWVVTNYPKLVNVFVSPDDRERVWHWQVSRLMCGGGDPALMESLIAQIRRYRM